MDDRMTYREAAAVGCSKVQALVLGVAAWATEPTMVQLESPYVHLDVF